MALPSGTGDNMDALSGLAAVLGVCWAAYDDAGRSVGSAPPHADSPCVHSRRCPILHADGTCPAAATAPLGADGHDGSNGRVVACHGTPLRPATAELSQALADSLRCRQQAEQEMQSTVRELAATYQELAIAYGVLEAISLPSSREIIAHAMMTHIATAVNADGACFLYLGGVDAARGGAGEPQALATVKLSDLDLAALRAVLKAELDVRPGLDVPFTLELGERQVLACAIRSEEAARGVMAVCRDARTPFTSREAKLLSASGRQAALAIRNRALVEELQSLFVSTIQALVAAIEAKDPYTCGHSRRVAETARLTARMLGLSEAEQEQIHTAAIVHDVGKIAVDSAILRKVGKLDDEEWRAVRIHPERGAGIINCIPQLREIVGAVRHHHERNDGRGYPLGLQGWQIPLQAGIIAVCDSYDAMTSERPYRAGLLLEDARRELVRCSGSQFEPSVVEAFLETVAA